MRAITLTLVALFIGGCRSEPPAPDRGVVGWRHVGSWSGRGNAQTENFTSDTGQFRVVWEARNETKPGTGSLKVIFRSGDSGSPIIEAVDHRGPGRGTAHGGDRPRWYYLTIDSADVDWSVTVEEPILGETVPP